MAGRKVPAWKAVAALVLAVVFVSHFPGTAAAQTFERSYREAVEARDSGDRATAISHLEKAISLAPDHVDALFLLGSLYGSANRLDEALAMLRRALRLAPDYTDVRLAIARVTSWRGDTPAAVSLVEEVLAAHPDHVGAMILRARLAYYVEDLDRSEAGYRQVLDRDPDNVEALLGLGDIEAAAADYAAAKDFYRRAAAIDPRSPEVQERLSRRHPRVFDWRLDTSGSYSWFTRQPRASWREWFSQLSYRLSPRTVAHGRLEISERFDRVDTFLRAGIHHRPFDWLTAYLYAGGTPAADFRERLTVAGGGTARLWAGGEAFGATVITLDAKWAKYRTGEVKTVKPGLQQYFLAGRLWFTGQWINIVDEGGNYLQGWFGRADAQVLDRVRLYGGGAIAPETVRSVTVQTVSAFAGVVVDLDERLGLHLVYARDDREDSFVRHTHFWHGRLSPRGRPRLRPGCQRDVPRVPRLRGQQPLQHDRQPRSRLPSGFSLLGF